MNKRALLIGTAHYQDERFAPLACTGADTAQLSQVLAHPHIGGFEQPEILADPTAEKIREAVESFLGNLTPQDLGVLYISGHGVRLRDSGEFVFAASDTDSGRLEQTGVCASFVNELLEECRSPQKVAILDCCYSGGYALGLRTRESKSTGRPQPPLSTRGVYVLSSSGADESSYGGGESEDGLEPSVFTDEIVQALHSGRGDVDGDGTVSVDELFHHVSERVRARDLDTPQRPTASSYGVNGRIDLAWSYSGTPLDLRTPPPVPERDTRETGKASAPTSLGWRPLLDYYHECLEAEATSRLPVFDVSDEQHYTCLTGVERLLSGDLDASESIAVPQEATEFLERAATSNTDLWYGYPAVVLLEDPTGKPYRSPHFAPLLVRQVELVEGPEGPRLKPYGEPKPHPELARRFLGGKEAANLAETYRPSWHAGAHPQLVRDVRHHLDEYELSVVDKLLPEELAERIDTRTPVSGARNAAVLFGVPQSNSNATANLRKDLKYIAEREATVSTTALGALLDDSASAAVGPRDWHPVTPVGLNAGQAEVLKATMNRKLTVATGPPGTGKSQLVANVVATALGSGQSVLVASTNNRAVDEVWNRCDDLVPGSVIRTGSSSGQVNYQRKEIEALQRLLSAESAAHHGPTAEIELREADERFRETLANLETLARVEKRLLDIGQRREETTGQRAGPHELTERIAAAGIGLARLAARARKVAETRFFGQRRRNRLLGKLGYEQDGSSERCRAIADFADVEGEWRAAREEHSCLPADDELVSSLATSQDDVRHRSQRLLDSVVRMRAREGHQTIRSFVQDCHSGNRPWSVLKEVLGYVRGWAVSNLSARQFPTQAGLFDLVVVDEASQCSIPAVLPLLYRAKRALIIGDAMQLSPVITLKAHEEEEARHASGVGASRLEHHRLSYRRHSAFHACRQAAGSSMLLDQHYRCHPDIASLASREFYEGELSVLTDVRSRPKLPERSAIIWASVSGMARRGRTSSWLNTEEADRVTESVHHLLTQLPETASVGVVTPFRDQAHQLERTWRGNDRVRVGTVHTFQGGEQHAIVMSLVASKHMSPGTLAWLTGEANLWNVAITRAKSHLIVVGDRDLWRDQEGIGQVLAHVAEPGGHTGDRGWTSGTDPLLPRLYKHLTATANSSVDIAVPVDGHHADAVTSGEKGSTAVLLDRTFDSHPDAHLRLQYERLPLLAGDGRTAIRFPAWRLFDT